ncbi:MAG: alpha/beta hydrolase, partial [Actinobacteria bacterium]|nr:alpha/beta hydrolase [Gemmatimonadota bacterium]NIR41644.1 alpha/beta hydrolase [Actinomycetota bacterium]NIU22480.1 alpha/beta hydrolase [Actinomycetota bacterium]NIU79767.1 alpha/beta fold hydrolase [Gammaproteobacteria bacterium]NIX48277.1 alpha/beta fold hydrolase [Gemmatimonadota bacterium]
RAWGEGPTVVLLHGGSGSWTHWIRVVPGLARGRRVLAADLPGLGDSAMPAPGYTAPSLASAVAQGIEALAPGPGPIRVVGFSFGG